MASLRARSGDFLHADPITSSKRNICLALFLLNESFDKDSVYADYISRCALRLVGLLTDGCVCRFSADGRRYVPAADAGRRSPAAALAVPR